MRQDGVTGKIGQQEWLKPAEEGLTKSDSQSLPDQRRPTGEEFSSWNMDRAPPSRHSHRRSDWRLDSDYCLRRAGRDGHAARTQNCSRCHAKSRTYRRSRSGRFRLDRLAGHRPICAARWLGARALECCQRDSVWEFASSPTERRTHHGPEFGRPWLCRVSSCRSARRQSGLRAEDRSRPHRCRKAAGGVHTGARGIACGRWQASEG